MERWSTSLSIRQMQIKTIVRYHTTPTRMALVKKTDNSNCSGWGKCGFLIHWWWGWECKMVKSYWKTFQQFLKILNTDLLYAQKLNSQIFNREKWKCMSIQNLYTSVHSKIIHKGQRVWKTQMPINWWNG